MKLFQIVPISQEGKRLAPDAEEFTNLEEAREYLKSTQEKWTEHLQVLIIKKPNNEVVEFWQEI